MRPLASTAAMAIIKRHISPTFRMTICGGMLGLWDFTKAQPRFQTEQGRRKLAGCEQEVVAAEVYMDHVESFDVQALARDRVRQCLYRFMCVFMLVLLGAAPSRPVTFNNYASDFDAFEARTVGLPADARVAAFRAEFERIAPGLYADRDVPRLDRRINKALTEFPAIRTAYRQVEERFAPELAAAVDHFRVSFPEFVPPMQIILAHELGMRDGGTDYVGDRKVMLFGADVIAKIHNDDSLQPFLEHELFHLEHARHFADCDQLWCPLWQEGLATYAVSVMTPGASDHQLLLDQPAAIRPATDARWGEALCWFAGRFDSDARADADGAFTAGSAQPGFPPRFGYYVGLRIALQASSTRSLSALSRLNDQAARPVVAKALAELIAATRAPCRPPRSTGPITHGAPRTP